MNRINKLELMNKSQKLDPLYAAIASAIYVSVNHSVEPLFEGSYPLIGQNYVVVKAECDADAFYKCLNRTQVNSVLRTGSRPTINLNISDDIKKVIFNDPATIVIWKDGTKTIVKCGDEPFDPEKGLAMAISKYVFGNKGNYYNEFKKYLPKEEEKSDLEEFEGLREKVEEMGNKILRISNTLKQL